MLYQGVGWIRPTRLAPEGSPFFAVPGGSLAGLSDLMTEVPLNGRLAGLGCEGNRQCAPCAAAKLDQNRRESMDGLRGAQMAMQDQPRGWGLGAEESFGVDEAAELRPEDILFAADSTKRQAAVEFLQTMLGVLRDAGVKAQAIGAPGWWPGESYWQQFLSIQQPVLAQVEAGASWKVRDWMTEEERDSYAHALNAFNSAVLKTQSARDASSVDRFKATLMNLGLTINDVGKASSAIGHVIADTAGNIVNQAGDILHKAADAGASVGKWVTVAIVAAAVLYGMSFLPRGRG